MNDYVKEFAALTKAAYDAGDLDIEDVESVKAYLALDASERQSKYGSGIYGHYANEQDYLQEEDYDE